MHAAEFLLALPGCSARVSRDCVTFRTYLSSVLETIRTTEAMGLAAVYCILPPVGQWAERRNSSAVTVSYFVKAKTDFNEISS